MSNELTVENCLEELREMFPDSHFLFVKHEAMIHASLGSESRCDVQTENKSFRAATPSEAMAQVRAFKQSQAKEQVKSE